MCGITSATPSLDPPDGTTQDKMISPGLGTEWFEILSIENTWTSVNTACPLIAYMFTETAIIGIATASDASLLVTSSSSHTNLPLVPDRAVPIDIDSEVLKTFHVWFEFEGGYTDSVMYHLNLICGLENISVT